MLGTPVVCFALDGFGFVLVGICRRDMHPFWAVLLLLPFALLGSIFVLAFLLLLLWLLFLLLQLLDLRFQGKNFLHFWGRCVPSFGLFECFEFVISKEHEGIWFDLCSFLVFIFLFADVGDEFSVQYSLVCLEEVCQEVVCCSPLAVKESIKSLT